MKLTKISRKLNIQSIMTIWRNARYKKMLITSGVLGSLAIVIWFGSPYLTWQGKALFALPEKRIYAILFIFFASLLKFLLIDLNPGQSLAYKDSETRKRLQELQNRFHGALQFLRKTSISQPNKLITLDTLPWFLLLGPANAGKTSLLANSDANFILQRQFSKIEAQQLPASLHCDWWVTRDACILDVPSHYFIPPHQETNGNRKRRLQPLLWHSLLRLIKKYRGRQALSGIIIALPLPEIMLAPNNDQYQLTLRTLFKRLQELQKAFPPVTTCHLMITKCDLLPGFMPFFAESSAEETIQPWGITLPKAKSGENAVDIFIKQFDMLVKRLNQQLIFRLHQERNPITRPYIKDFPLQIEALKENVEAFIKKFSSINFSLCVQRVYLTSATQPSDKQKDGSINESINAGEKTLQLFKAPKSSSRPFFIKHIITQGIANSKIAYPERNRGDIIKRTSLYAASITTITITAIFFGQDFERGVKKAYSIQNELSQYQIAIQQSSDANDSLKKTLNLLNSLQPNSIKLNFDVTLATLIHFYSNKAQQKSDLVYQQALQAVLLPEVSNYLRDTLKRNINQNGESVYALLKAYLALANTSGSENDYLLYTIQQLLPTTFAQEDKINLIRHFKLALRQPRQTIALDTNLIEKTRNYLNATPSLKLAFIILKNIDDNSRNTVINLGTTDASHHTFSSNQTNNEIPIMFTAKALNKILTLDTAKAAQEAIRGNAIIGDLSSNNLAGDQVAELAEQLRLSYLNNYIEIWENTLANINIATPTNLAQVDAMMMDLISNDSPLLQLLETVHRNTYFDVITSLSPKLNSLDILLDKTNNNDALLYQLFVSLRSTHRYLLPILTAQNQPKTAFDIVSDTLKNTDMQNELAQLRVIADRSPEPIKAWLTSINDQTWQLLLQDASHYLNTAWQTDVMRDYKAKIENQYPFTANTNAQSEVELQNFVQFFGNTGTLITFYNKYLQSFIDTSAEDWQWKTINNAKLPFSDATLKQLQHAMRINQTFFPNGDNKLLVQFAIQPYKIDKFIKEIKLNINEKQIVDNKASDPFAHRITWPNNERLKDTTLQLSLKNNKIITKRYPGNWGWFKLVTQSFENAITRKQAVINFTLDNHSAKYLLFTEGKSNPFLSLNMHNFQLSEQL